MKFILVVILLFLYVNAEASPKSNQVYDDGVCYEEIWGEEKENQYWIRCGELDDPGFNRLNCESETLHGVWIKMLESCILSKDGMSWRFSIQDGFYHIEEWGGREI